MPLLLNSLLAQLEIEPKTTRLLRHQDQRAARGRTPYELWRDDQNAFNLYQSVQSFQNRPYLNPASTWVSFVVRPDGESLLAGIYDVKYLGDNDSDLPWPHADGFDPKGTKDVYELLMDQRALDLSGKLIIDWGPGTRSWIQRADNQNKAIIEIAQVFKEPEFPGFTRFLSPLSRIEGLPKSWAQTLSSSKGVYLLTCPKTHEQYVGSAYGDNGFWGRWMEYVRTGHGGNVALKSREFSDYQVSILEVAGSAATSDDIMRMETLWKDKLQSREMGLNRN